MRNRIKEHREKAGISQDKLADLVHAHRVQINRLENGKRTLTQDWMEKIAAALRIDPADLLPARQAVGQVMVCGDVQAGAWREALQWPEEDWYEAPVPDDPRYAGVRRFALEVRGASMNRVYPDGTILICVNPAEAEMAPKPGQRVIVQRRSPEGLIEATVKELQQDEAGGYWLWPRSDHPEHQTPIRVDDGEEAEITGLVIGSYRPE